VSLYPFPGQIRIAAVVQAIRRAERTDGPMIRSIHILGHHTTLVQALFRSVWAFRVLVRDLILCHQVGDLTAVLTVDNSELTFGLQVPREPVSSEVPDAARAAVVIQRALYWPQRTIGVHVRFDFKDLQSLNATAMAAFAWPEVADLAVTLQLARDEPFCGTTDVRTLHRPHWTAVLLVVC
jgi:hypothetical protein